VRAGISQVALDVLAALRAGEFKISHNVFWRWLTLNG
jgi:hypothetical protein